MLTPNTTAVGTSFPVDATVDSIHGPATLSQMFATGPIVVAFHRLGCPFSDQAARELAKAEYQFDAAGTRVVIVYRDDIDTVAQSATERAIPFDCVSDTADLAPERATFVIDRDARIVYAHHSDTAFDTVPVDDVLDAVRTAAYTRTAA